MRVLQDVDLMVIDFLSYELMPARSFRCDGLELDQNGFVVVDRRQHTNLPGLFAAGDVTGTPAAVATAIAEGVTAGFEAYRHVYRQKFLGEPSLFAYYGVDRELRPGVRELPSLPPAEYGPEILSDAASMLQLARRRFWGADRGIAVAMVERIADSPAILTIQNLADGISVDVQVIERIIERFLRFKQMTLQPLKGAARGR
jgi:hypothetical protein